MPIRKIQLPNGGVLEIRGGYDEESVGVIDQIENIVGTIPGARIMAGDQSPQIQDLVRETGSPGVRRPQTGAPPNVASPAIGTSPLPPPVDPSAASRMSRDPRTSQQQMGAEGYRRGPGGIMERRITPTPQPDGPPPPFAQSGAAQFSAVAGEPLSAQESASAQGKMPMPPVQRGRPGIQRRRGAELSDDPYRPNVQRKGLRRR